MAQGNYTAFFTVVWFLAMCMQWARKADACQPHEMKLILTSRNSDFNEYTFSISHKLQHLTAPSSSAREYPDHARSLSLKPFEVYFRTAKDPSLR
jgi:hypothetical protein